MKNKRSEVVADGLHSAAIHLLRRVRKQDTKTGEGPARLSALSVLVFGGPKTLGELAAAEQVRPPTMTRICDRAGTQRAGGAGERSRGRAAGKNLCDCGRRRHTQARTQATGRLPGAGTQQTERRRDGETGGGTGCNTARTARVGEPLIAGLYDWIFVFQISSSLSLDAYVGDAAHQVVRRLFCCLQ